MINDEELRMKIRRISGAALLLMVAIVLMASAPAAMHLRLVKAEPAADTTVTAAPREIRLFFSQEPEIRATKVTVTDAASTEVTVATAKADAKDGKIVIALITGAVAPGNYTVTWRTMAKDGHAVNGTFHFTLRAAD
jgi:methionine-rich copper-binding protein CopC